MRDEDFDVTTASDKSLPKDGIGRALVLAGVVQGFSTAPLLLLIMLMTNNRKIMGDRVNGLGANILGWTTTAVIFLASAALIGSWFV
ncbi:MAG TPA: hypothetical protein VFN88_04145 [Caulobacteraceae bacterium]|nr:hypothetical protein [Caulobacteraceae bacterium]